MATPIGSNWPRYMLAVLIILALVACTITMASTVAAPLANTALLQDRASVWPPNPLDWIQWRYVAGRIVDGAEDMGFIVSLSDNFLGEEQLLVQRKNHSGDLAFASQIYTGTLAYDTLAAIYTFKDSLDQTLATWQWNQADQRYQLTVTTPELALTDIRLVPQGDLIPEGGDGAIQVGRIDGRLIASDYHADWANIEIGGQVKGTARIDMQGLRPTSDTSPDVRDYAHHWFAVAVELDDGTPAWISAWRIEAPEGPYWTVTIASGSGPTWAVERALNEDNSQSPLNVAILEWQDIPSSGSSGSKTGHKWRLAAPDGSLEIDLDVLPGQFISDNPLSGLGGPARMQEALGLAATGTVLGQTISTVKLAVVETTAEYRLAFLPITTR